MRPALDFARIRALIIDIDGTLWRGEQPLPGLAGLFAFLKRRDIAGVVATNNTVETPAAYRQKLARFGVRVASEQILTAAGATAQYLQSEFAPGAPLYVIGEACLQQTLAAGGFILLDDARRRAAAVVVGGDRTLTYDKLKTAIRQLHQGARLIGTNPDLLIPTEDGLAPEAGTTLAALQAAAGVAPTVIGKPERHLFEMALARLGSTPDETAMVGDRLETDIAGAQRAGLQAILVTTGVDDEQAIARQQIYPDAVFSDLHALVAVWQAAL